MANIAVRLHQGNAGLLRVSCGHCPHEEGHVKLCVDMNGIYCVYFRGLCRSLCPDDVTNAADGVSDNMVGATCALLDYKQEKDTAV